MLSKTKIKSRSRKKTNPALQETIALALRNPEWIPIAKILSSSTRKFSKVNLFQIDSQTKAGDSILIPGKVLSKGELTKQVEIVALTISETAKEKLRNSKSKFHTILEEIKNNPKAEGLKVIQEGQHRREEHHSNIKSKGKIK